MSTMLSSMVFPDRGPDEDSETACFRYSHRGGVSHDLRKLRSDVVVVEKQE